MSHIKNLADQEAIKKLQSLAKEKTCFFSTYTDPFDVDSRPMFTQSVEEDGSIWFFSQAESHTNKQILENNKVNLSYANANGSYLFVKGEASVSKDRQIIDKLWSPFAKTWFPEGKDDPQLTLIQVNPVEANYWDTEHGKIVSLIKIAWSTLTGDTKDDGVQGKLEVHK
ncbi:MAG: pyridoxamine 5'-phosphate oxidase family protein [Verrucomicrobia bacterium]|nr:pyridoxamine 5'-phosphate oxidase family protein [Cytophagales bacterium]